MKITLLLFFFSLLAAEFPRIVWVYWDSGADKLPSLYQLCLGRMRSILEPKWEIRFVSDSTIQQWLDDPEVQTILNFAQLMKLPYKVQYKSDYIRLTLLEKHGGVWMDTGDLLLEDLEWLFTLKDNPSVINKIGDAPDVFQFSGGNPFVFPSRIKDGKQFSVSPQGDSWFIAAIPKARLLNEWKATLKTLFFGDLQNYKQTLQKTKVRLGTITYSQLYLMVYQAEQIVLQTKQQELDAIGSQVLSVQHYKLWCISSNKGPLSLYTGAQFNRLKQDVRKLITLSVKEINLDREAPRYLIKIYGSLFTALNHLFLGNETAYNQQIDNNSVHISLFGLEKYWPCLYYPVIKKDSLAQRLLLNPLPESFKGTIYKPEQIPQICRVTQIDEILIYSLWIILATVLAVIFIYFTKKSASPSIPFDYQSLSTQNKVEFVLTENILRQTILSIAMMVISSLLLSARIVLWVFFSFPIDSSTIYLLFLWTIPQVHFRRAHRLPKKQVYFMRVIYSLLLFLQLINGWECIVNCFHNLPILYETIASELVRIVHKVSKIICFVVVWTFFIEFALKKTFSTLK